MTRSGFNSRSRWAAVSVLLGVLAAEPAMADETSDGRGPRLTPDLSERFNQSSFDDDTGLRRNVGDLTFGRAILSDMENFMFIEAGAGAAIPLSGVALTGFGQTLHNNVGINGFVGIGTVLHPIGQPFAYEVGLRVDALSLRPRVVTNNPPVPGSLAVSGSHTAISLNPRFGVIFRPGLTRRQRARTALYAGISAGPAFQRVILTLPGGANVLTGAGTTPTVALDAGIRVPLAEGLSADFGGELRWLGGFQARTSTNVVTMTGDRLVGTLRASLRLTFNPRTRTRIRPVTAERLPQRSRLLFKPKPKLRSRRSQ